MQRNLAKPLRPPTDHILQRRKTHLRFTLSKFPEPHCKSYKRENCLVMLKMVNGLLSEHPWKSVSIRIMHFSCRSYNDAKRIKDGASFWYCAYVLRISGYWDFLRDLPPNSEIFSFARFTTILKKQI